MVRITVIENSDNLFDETFTKDELWYNTSDVKLFKASVKSDNEDDRTLTKLRNKHHNSQIWFQTFGKFYAENGEEFTQDHEATLWGCPMQKISYTERKMIYQKVAAKIGKTPIEYRRWEDSISAAYFGGKKTRLHSDFAFSEDDLPTHADFLHVHNSHPNPDQPLAHFYTALKDKERQELLEKLEKEAVEARQRGMSEGVGVEEVDGTDNFLNLGEESDFKTTVKERSKSCRKVLSLGDINAGGETSNGLASKQPSFFSASRRSLLSLMKRKDLKEGETEEVSMEDEAS
jgi:hypothetical protein